MSERTVMSSVLDHIEANPQESQRLIGLGYPELQILLQNAEKLHHEKQATLESKKIRIISGGGGRKPKLSIKEQIILTLVYLRHMTYCPLKFCQPSPSRGRYTNAAYGTLR
ncbi:MAG: helix-turn-helix domain-containing protein [Brasilonema sp.]